MNRLVLLIGDDVTAHTGRQLLASGWDRLSRSLRPTYGARANAADSLIDLRRTRRSRAEAAGAPSPPPATCLGADQTGGTVR